MVFCGLFNKLYIFLIHLNLFSESVLFNYSKDQQSRIEDLFKNYGFIYQIIPFATTLYSDDCLNENLNINQHNNKLKNIFINISDLTLKEDMLMKLR